MRITLNFALALALLGASPALSQEQPRASSQEERSTMETASKVKPAVVSIRVVMEKYDGGKKENVSGVGSGVLIDPQGHVLTNFHVAGHAKTLIVTMANGEKVGADLVGADPYTDLAVIKLHLDELKTTNLSWASLGDSDQVTTGQSVLAIGSPAGLKQTATKGIVSNSDRYFSGEFRLPTGERTGEFNTWIQTDAPLNGGNSGGPLVNNRGEVIGINSRGRRGADGLGFAVPINIAKNVVGQILDHGRVVRSWAGLELQPMEDFAKFFEAELGEGVLVASVVKDSPADRAGIRTGDVMLSWNDEKTDARFMRNVPAVRDLMARTPPGTEVAVRVLREKKELHVALTPQELEAELGEEYECRSWKCTVRGMTKFLALSRKLDTVAGVLVLGVEDVGPARDGELRVGDVVLRVDGKAVDDLGDFKAKLQETLDSRKPAVLLTVQRGKSIHLIVIEPSTDRD